MITINHLIFRLEHDFIYSTTEAASYQTTKATVQKDEVIEETNVDLSVVALAILNVTTKPNTVLNESRPSVIKKTPDVTHQNVNLKPLKIELKTKLFNTQINPIFTKVTTKALPNLVLKDPRLIMKSSNKEISTIGWTKPASILVINATTTTSVTPPQLQEVPLISESIPDLSVISKATVPSVSHSNVVKESEAQQLQNMTKLSNSTKMVSFEKPVIKTATEQTSPDLYDKFFSECKRLIGVCVVFFCSIGVVYLFYVIFIQK